MRNARKIIKASFGTTPVKKVKVLVSDLKKSLVPPAPGLRPATKADLVRVLRARQELVHKRDLIKKKSRISGRMIAEGKVGTRYSDWRLIDLKRIAPSKNPNAVLAQKVLKIYENLRNLTFEIPANEHQALVNIANKTVKNSLKNQKVVLTPLEQKALDFYYRSASN